MPHGTSNGEHDPTLMEAVDELVAAGANGITSFSELSRRMNALDGRQTADSWFRSLKRYRAGQRPDEEVYEVVAAAFDVPRSDLPAASQRLTLKTLEIRLQRLEAQAHRSYALADRCLRALVEAGIELPDDEPEDPESPTGRQSNG